MPEEATLKSSRRIALKQLLPLQLGLIALWIMLWGDFSWMTILTGIVLAILAPWVFYLPPVELTGRLHLGWSAWFVSRLLFDISRASFQVAAQAFGIKHSPLNAVIEVHLRTRNDLIMTIVAEATSLVPGSLVLDVDRARGYLYVHVFSVRSQSDVEAARAAVLKTEQRVLRAFGSEEEYELVKPKAPKAPKAAKFEGRDA